MVNNYTANAGAGGNNDQHNARVDHTFSGKQRAFLRYPCWTNLNLPIDPYQRLKRLTFSWRKSTARQGARPAPIAS